MTGRLGSDVVLYPRMGEQSNDTPGVPAFPTSQHIWTDNDAFIYSGQIFVPNYNNTGYGTLTFAKNIDDINLLSIDGISYITNGQFNNPVLSGPLTMFAGWHNIQIEFMNSTGGAGASGQNTNGWTGWTTSIGFIYRVDNGPNDLLANSKNVSDYTIPTDNGTGNLFRLPSLTKTGAGTLTLGAVNSFLGAAVINQGTVVAAVDGALGTSSTGGTYVSQGASLILPAGLAYQTASQVFLAGTGVGGNGALESQGDGTSFAGSITLAAPASIGSDAGKLTFGAATINLAGSNLALAGPGNFNITDGVTGMQGAGITKVGGGTATLSGNNSYGGPTLVNQGMLIAASSNALGTVAGSITIASGATLGLSGGITLPAKLLYLGGAGVGGIGALDNLSGINNFPGPITETAFTSIGSSAGTLTLAGNISTVTPGLLETQIGEFDAYADPASGNPVLGSDFVLDPQMAELKNAVLQSQALPTYEHLWTEYDTWIYSGQIYFPNYNNTGFGTLSFARNVDDTALLRIDGVAYPSSSVYGATTATGPITLSTGWHSFDLRLANLVGVGGSFDFNNSGWTGWSNNNGFVYRVDNGPADSLASSKNVNDYVIPSDDGSGSFFRYISTTSGLTKTGSGTVGLSGTNNFVGRLTINAGTLLVDGTLTGGAVSVAGGTLGGGGTIKSAVAVAAVSNLSPGDDPATTATLQTESLQLDKGSILNIALGGASPGQYDQFVISPTGTVNLNGDGADLGGATLNISLVSGFTPTVGQRFEIIDNQGSSAVAGSFLGPINDGGTIVVNNLYAFTVSYIGGDGNDVVLTAVALVPTATAISSTPKPSSYGQSVSFTAAVNAAGAPVTTGTVTFEEGSTILAGYVPLDANGHAGFSIATLPALGSAVFITALYNGTGQFQGSSGTTSQTVNPRAMSVTANAETKTYGTADPALTYQITAGALVSGDVFTGALTRVPGETLGSYAIQQGTLALNGNYALTYVAAKLIITPANFVVSVPGGNTVVAGAPFLVTVQAVDSFGNPVTGYSGPPGVTITASPPDPQSNFQISSALQNLNVGFGFFQGNLATAGTYTLTAIGGDFSGTSLPITVIPAKNSYFTVAAPPAATTGNLVNVTVKAHDQFGNLATGYNGLVQLTSTDLAAALGTNYTFTTGAGQDNGVHTFSVTLNTSGGQTITATDIHATNPTVTGISSPVTTRGLVVTALTPTPTGFTATFSKAFVPADLTLYGSNLKTVADVVLSGNNGVGPVHGSLIIDPANQSFTFKATASYLQLLNSIHGGNDSVVLPDATYTVKLISGSGSNGLLDALGAGLDGANNAGHANYTTTFTTHYQANATPVLALPDFART